jgi:ankyrin repeat protein
MVTLVLKAGAELEARDKYSQTPLYFAVRAEKRDALDALIAAGADVNAKFKSGQSALHEAVSRGKPDYVSALLKGGASVDQRDSQGKTPLFDAVAYDRVEVIPVLLAAGADPTARNKSGESIEQIGKRARSARALELIKDAKKVDVAPVKTIPSPNGTVGTSSADPKADLKKLGFNFDSGTFFNRVETEDVRAIGLFLKGGMDPGTRNEMGRTALWEAVEGGHADSVKALLAGGANANDGGQAKDKRLDYGETMVMKAVDGGDMEILRALVDAGADVNKSTQYKIGPLASAARNGRLDMVEILVKAGANVNAVDTAGTPVVYGAVQESHLDVVKFLLKSGAKVGQKKKLLLDAAKSPEMKKLIQGAQ